MRRDIVVCEVCKKEHKLNDSRIEKERKLTVKGALKKIKYLEYVKQAPPALVQ